MKKKFKQIGEVGVDSGQILICDPCYINSEWTPGKKDEDIFNKKNKGQFSYSGCCLETCDTEDLGGQLNYKKGHAGAGVAVSSGYGDGCYPVYAIYNSDGRVSKLIIDFNENGNSKKIFDSLRK